jgi:hypothetical protein
MKAKCYHDQREYQSETILVQYNFMIFLIYIFFLYKAESGLWAIVCYLTPF